MPLPNKRLYDRRGQKKKDMAEGNPLDIACPSGLIHTTDGIALCATSTRHHTEAGHVDSHGIHRHAG